MVDMELKEPKTKRWCHLELEQPFPIFIQSEVGVPIDNWIPFVYTGIFNGFGVIVKDSFEINALHSMGNFGKGCFSRSRPEIMRNNPKLPHIIKKRQYLHRQTWVEKRNLDENVSLPTPADEFLDEIADLHAFIDKVSNKDTRDNTYCEAINLSENSDVMNISSDEEISENITINKASVNAPEPLKENNEYTIEDLIFPLNSVIVMSDSESEKENSTENYFNPKLFIDQSENQEHLVLTLPEAFFLAYGLGCLQILDQNEKFLELKESWKLFSNTDPSFCFKYIVYHYYRSKGWVVKPGIKFGGDFLLYKEGQPYYHASYIVLVNLSNLGLGNNNSSWRNIVGLLRMAGTAAKELIIVQVNKPDSIVAVDLSEDPSNIVKFKVSEILLRRWISNQERGEDDYH